MRCKICNNIIIMKRGIKDFLTIKNYDVCDTCYDKYKINITYNILPLDNHKLYIYSLFDKEYIFKTDPYILEFSRLFSYVINNESKNDNILVFKNINITKYYINLFNDLSNLLNDDLILVCNYCQI